MGAEYVCCDGQGYGLGSAYDRSGSRRIYGRNARHDACGGHARLYAAYLPYGLKKIARYAVNVWGVDPTGKSDEQTAKEGLAALENWMRAIGLVMDLKRWVLRKT